MPKDILIGPAGWSYPDWAGIVYPTTRSRSFDPLDYLSGYFKLIEINSTFYRVPSRDTCVRWVERVAHVSGFTFTVKLFQEFTHSKTGGHESDVRDFGRHIRPIAEAGRLGAVLVQFPWSLRFGPVPVEYIRKLSKWLSPLRTVFELRHGSWAQPAAQEFFSQDGLCMVGVDQPQIGTSLGPDTYVPDSQGAYFRLHGRNRRTWFAPDAGRDARYDYLYSASETAEWRDRIRGLPARVQQVQVVMNNHFRGQAPANALALRAALENRKVASPPGLVAAYPDLPGLVAEAGPSGGDRDPSQGNLFHDR